MPLYFVSTWDTDADDYTPQAGMTVPSQYVTLWQLKAALKELRLMGYSCHYRRDPDGGHQDNDTSIYVGRVV